MLDGMEKTVGAGDSGIAWYRISRGRSGESFSLILRIDAHPHAKSDPRSQEIMPFD